MTQTIALFLSSGNVFSLLNISHSVSFSVKDNGVPSIRSVQEPILGSLQTVNNLTVQSNTQSRSVLGSILYWYGLRKRLVSRPFQ